jgi:hypothetical protein
MDFMTDNQFKDSQITLIELILEKAENSKTLEEAVAKIKALLKEKQGN